VTKIRPFFQNPKYSFIYLGFFLFGGALIQNGLFSLFVGLRFDEWGFDFFDLFFSVGGDWGSLSGA
jgi:hypothetical protein